MTNNNKRSHMLYWANKQAEERDAFIEQVRAVAGLNNNKWKKHVDAFCHKFTCGCDQDISCGLLHGSNIDKAETWLEQALQEAYNKGREEEQEKYIKILEKIKEKTDYLLELQNVKKRLINSLNNKEV